MHETVNDLRPRMMAVAHRMLGSVADAEDAVQDAFLRLQATEGVVSPEGFLVKTTTRRCLDHLRSRRRCDRFVESRAPAVANSTDDRKSDAATEPVSRAFLVMLERLTPIERGPTFCGLLSTTDTRRLRTCSARRSATRGRSFVGRACGSCRTGVGSRGRPPRPRSWQSGSLSLVSWVT